MKFETYDNDHQVVKHVMSCDRGGVGHMAWRQPKCTCGWKGDTTHAYDDYQHTSVEEQYREHYYEERNK